jgi:phage terminase large subunit
MNYVDNPWFPAELEAERLHDLKHRPETYGHIWEGECLEITDAQVFRNRYEIADFEIDATFGNPYFGMDFGFAVDPTTAVQCYVKERKLYIRRDCGKVGLELDDTGKYITDAMPEAAKHAIRADSARPESISYLRRNGLPRIESVKKWPGSVEDGIGFIKSFEKVIIHTDCVGTQKEFRLYSYKIDKNSGDIQPEIIDAFNHYIDALRYALVPLMKNRGASGFLAIS